MRCEAPVLTRAGTRGRACGASGALLSRPSSGGRRCPRAVDTREVAGEEVVLGDLDAVLALEEGEQLDHADRVDEARSKRSTDGVSSRPSTPSSSRNCAIRASIEAWSAGLSLP